MQKFTLRLKKSVFLTLGMMFMLLSAFQASEDGGIFIQQTLLNYYDAARDGSGLKRYEFNVTNTGLCKYRKIYTNGKTEFFSFNLSRLNNMAYYGTVSKGELYFFTNNDDVIVQTRNDRKGDVDTMATHMIIPLKGIEPDQLNKLAIEIKKFSETLIAAKQ